MLRAFAGRGDYNAEGIALLGVTLFLGVHVGEARAEKWGALPAVFGGTHAG